MSSFDVMRSWSNQITSQNVLIIGTVSFITLGLPLYILTHMFRSGAPDSSEPEHNAWIMSKCGGEKFWNSLLSFGYWKASLRRFVADHKRFFMPQPEALLGGRAVDCQLVDLEGKNLSLLQDIIGQCPPGVPLILNMGSYSAVSVLHKQYCSGPGAVARFVTIYIEEAHARDEWWLPDSPEASGRRCIAVHRTIDERLEAALSFLRGSVAAFPALGGPEAPLYCDSMAGQVADRYGAWPERLYVVMDGCVVYRGGKGPFGYKLHEVQRWLADKFGVRGPSLEKDCPT